jgi:hypothetical protein
MTVQRPVCVHCGAKYGSRITRNVRVSWPKGEPPPAYSGPGVVVKTSAPRPLWNEAMMACFLDVWDGESWSMPHEPFCTLRCALEYARKAFLAQDEADASARRQKIKPSARELPSG